MRRWLARLSMSFFVVAIVLFWQAYRWSEVEGRSGKVILSTIGAAVCLAGGLAGTRERHRPEV